MHQCRGTQLFGSSLAKENQNTIGEKLGNERPHRLNHPPVLQKMNSHMPSFELFRKPLSEEGRNVVTPLVGVRPIGVHFSTAVILSASFGSLAGQRSFAALRMTRLSSRL